MSIKASDARNKPPPWALITAVASGIAFIVTLLAIALFVPEPTSFQQFVFRVVLSLAAAGFGAAIPGFLNVKLPLWGKGLVSAGGALAMFAVVFLVNPPMLVEPDARPKGTVTSVNEVRHSVKTPPAESMKRPRAGLLTDRAAARFGVTLGWQLGRFEFIDGSPFPEAQRVAPELKRQILQLLEQQKYPHDVRNLNAQQIIDSVLTFYGTTDLRRHASILLGIGALRASMVGASSDSSKNDEMAALAASAIKSIDSSVVSDRDSLAATLVSRKPATVDAVLDVYEEWSAHSGAD